ncbi:class E sortase [Pseudolysinimonas kribbensis]|uniref:class E sortase n=1 Tax=Pseudolysinimonas kribbensis TaxID=433641 RepID=UPI0031D92A6F
MTEPEGDGAPAQRAAARPRRGRRSTGVRSANGRPRRRISVVGVLGEVLITAGVLVLMFLGWQLWLQDIIVGGQLHDQALQQSQKWDATKANTKPASSTTIPVAKAPANAQRFANLIVPRWNQAGQPLYVRPIAQGVGASAVLNKNNLGHYPTTQMPGDVGNFAIAAHRSAYGGNLHLIHQLHVGDHIYVETIDGWYQYSFRNLQYVQPTEVGVIDPVPEVPGVQAVDRMITLTSCNPFYSTAERIIAYGDFDKFIPRDDAKPDHGAPAEIADVYEGKK